MPRTLAQVPAGLEDRGDRAFSLWWSMLSRPHLRVRQQRSLPHPVALITSFVPHNNPLEHVAPACDGRPSPPGEGQAHGTWGPRSPPWAVAPGVRPAVRCAVPASPLKAPGAGCLEESA